MNIQNNYSVQAYQGTNRLVSTQAIGNGATASSAGTAISAASAGSGDQVTISAAARELAAKGSSATQARTPAQDKLLKSAASDLQSAEKIASDMANTRSTIFYDISGVGGGEPVNKLSSGRIIDDAFKEKFANEASVIDAQRRALYDTEKAKGTDPVEILAKMIDFTNAQSKDYLEASGWAYQGSQSS